MLASINQLRALRLDMAEKRASVRVEQSKLVEEHSNTMTEQAATLVDNTHRFVSLFYRFCLVLCASTLLI